VNEQRPSGDDWSLVSFGEPAPPLSLPHPDGADEATALALQARIEEKLNRVPENPQDERWLSDEWVDDPWVAKPVPTQDPVIVCIQDVKPEPVRWLWRHRIPASALVVLDGDPGIGKSTITLDLASRITRGARMPDGSVSESGLGDVLLVGAEDALSFAVRPRLEAAGADLAKVHGLTGIRGGDPPFRPVTLPDDTELLHRAILNTGAKLVIIDPVMAFLSHDINSNSDQEVRRVLTPLARMAEDTGATILLVRHLRKTMDGPSLYQGGGSIGIVGAARAGLVVVRDPRDESMCVLKQSKTNLGPWPPPIGYFLTGASTDAAATVKWVP
jgi:hypothetical protein